MIPTLSETQILLEKYNKEPFHIKHAQVVSDTMRYFAREYDAQEEEYWGVVGMLHDIDFEMYPDEHCFRGVEILRSENIDESIIRAAMSHGYGVAQESGICQLTYKPEHIMEKILFAADELTGLIGAAALMRPSKSVSDMELSSLKKKYKDKKFAAGCSRDVINRGAEMLGWPLDELLQKTLDAMKSFETKSAELNN